MIITADSHLDHALTPAHITFLLKKFGRREGFAIEQVRLPTTLGALPCALHGPLVGGAPISSRDAYEEIRGGRKGPTRVVDRAPKSSRVMTVIFGPHEGKTILYTAYGGPLAPREPWDPALSAADRIKSEHFWSQHALSSSKAMSAATKKGR